MFILDLIFQDRDKCYFCKDRKEFKYDNLCRDCYNFLEFRQGMYVLENYVYVYSLLEYNRYLKPHMYKYKYGKASYYSRVFSRLLIKDPGVGELMKKIDYIIAVPLHRRRQALRGYNQAELIARDLSDYFKIPYRNNIIYRKKNTSFQNKLNVNDRKKNLKGAFILGKTKGLEGKSILVFDDIYTTGSTFYYCARELKKIENIELYGLSLATGKN